MVHLCKVYTLSMIILMMINLVVDFALLLAGIVAAGVVEAKGVSFVQGHLRRFFSFSAGHI